jgi:transketolase
MNLKKRIIDLSYKHGLTHIGSCLTSVNIIDKIYKKKKDQEPFILSNGHAGLALYVVLEQYGFGDAEAIWLKHGTHPNRDMPNGIWCSTGSLGQGLPIAIGMALSNRNRNVYCLISDGECAEGSIWESLRIAKEQKLNNLKIYLNMNGWSAYGKINTSYLVKRINAFEFPVKIIITKVEQYPFLKGLDAHYYQMTKEDYEKT